MSQSDWGMLLFGACMVIWMFFGTFMLVALMQAAKRGDNKDE